MEKKYIKNFEKYKKKLYCKYGELNISITTLN